MHPEIDDLIGRMAAKEWLVPGFRASESDSWKARREAEALADVALVDDLVAAVATEPSRDRRRCFYFVIGKIGANAGDAGCAVRLLELAATEKDKDALAVLLERVGEIPKPASFDYAAIAPWLSDERWRVRHAAIAAFGNSWGSSAEEHVIRHLAGTNDPYDQVNCQAVLNQIGSLRAIPAIEKNFRSHKRDVRISAQLAIEAIRRRGR